MNIFSQSKLTLRMLQEGGAIVFGIILAIILCSWFASGIDSSVTTITKQRTLKYELESENEIASKLVADYKNVAQTKTLIERSFLPENNILEFVAAVDSIADKRSIVHSIRFDTPMPAGKTLEDASHPLTKVSFTLSLQSNVFIFDEFLKDLEHLPYFVTVDNVSISAQSATGWRDLSNITIHGTLFTRGEQQL